MKQLIITLMVVLFLFNNSYAVLVSYWDFNTGTGDTLYDKSGNGNHGIIIGATWVDGKEGKALNFDADSDFVDIPNIGGHTDFSFSVWVKVRSEPHPFTLSTGEAFLTFFATDDGTFVVDQPNLKFRYFSWDSRAGGTGFTRFNNAGGSITAESWTHAVLVAIDTSSLKLYVNSVLGSDTFWVDDPTGTYTDNRIGNHYEILDYTTFFGEIDEASIFDHALTQTEIDSLYNDQTEIKESMPVAKTPISIKQFYNSTVIFTFQKTPDNCQIMVYNITGQVIHTINDMRVNRQLWDTRGLSSGLYVLKANMGNTNKMV